MNKPEIEITQNFSDYFRAFVNITIPSTSTNLLSYYETVSLLVQKLEELQVTQNLTSKEYDSLVSQLLEYIATVKTYLDNWELAFKSEWEEFNAYLDNFEQSFRDKLKSDYDDFITKLDNLKAEVNEYITNFWNEADTNITNIANDGMTGLESIMQKYEDLVNTFETTMSSKINSWNTEVSAEINTYINDIKNIYTTIEETLTTKQTEFTTLVNEAKVSWEEKITEYTTDITNKYNEFNSEYKNIAQTTVNKYDIKDGIKVWGLKNGDKLIQDDSLIIKITYFSSVTPDSPSVDDLWYNDSLGSLFTYDGSSWVQTEIREDKLYSYEGRLYYFATGTSQDIDFVLPINVSATKYVLSYHDNILYIAVGTTIYECNLESGAVTNTWENVEALSYLSTQVDGYHTDRMVYADNKYFFSYNDDPTSADVKNYCVDSIQDFVDKNFNEITFAETVTNNISNIVGGYRNNHIFVPCLITGSSNLCVYSTSSIRNFGTTTLKGFYSSTYSFMLNGSNNFLLMFGNGVGTGTVAVSDSGYGTDIWMELDKIFNGIGFADKSSYTGDQTFAYQDDLVGDKAFVTSEYYYKYNQDSGILRRVSLSDYSVNDYSYSELFDMVDDYVVDVYLDTSNLHIKLLNLNSTIDGLKEIGYKVNE